MILGGVAVVGVGGYFLYQAMQPTPNSVGAVLGVDTSMPTTNLTLSLSSQNTFNVPPPPGGTITNVSISGPIVASNRHRNRNGHHQLHRRLGASPLLHRDHHDRALRVF
jgi:hypothetical protein